MNRGFGARFFTLVEEMAPANFAMVMSTGIISVALRILGCRWGAVLLYGVNLVMYALLWGLLLLRLVRCPGRVARDFASHARGPGFLTIVAGTCILGTQSAVLAENFTAAAWLFWFGAACWAFILWGVFLAIFTGSNKPSLAGGINGAWLVATVSTQSLVILGATLAVPLGWNAELSWFCLCALFMLGIVLYILVITGIFHRFCFADMAAGELDPAYWINASAAAITTLAGATLMLKAGAAPLLGRLLPYITGVTLLAWATASWWVPMLILLGVWRHGVKKYPFIYTPAYWGMVFPLGMYTACTAALSLAYDIAPLMYVPRVFIVPALAAWGITLAGMLCSRGRALLAGTARPRG